MKFVTVLLGSAAGLITISAAQAADLPMRKAAPVAYVKVCDAYGAGFFFIPGTDTCIKIGGRVRADYAFSGAQNIYSGLGTASRVGPPAVAYVPPGAGIDSVSGARLNTLATSRDAVNRYGWEARGRVDLDARTQTAWGTVQTVLALRLARTTGVLSAAGPGLSASSASPTLEAAYIRFAGFTFGAARDNFSFMPSTFYGAGHWASFANGAKQLAYTAILGGGYSATIAVHDPSDTTAGGVTSAGNAASSVGGFTLGTSSTPLNNLGAAYAYNNMPQLNGNITLSQGWGTAEVMGAVGKAVGVNSSASYNQDKTVYAVGAGLKLNMPMIAAGDVLYLNGAYANGMTEYTTNWTSFKSSDTKLNVGGFVVNHPSWINAVDSSGNGSIETLKSWDIAALYTHYWTPTIRHSFLATYGQIDGTTSSKALPYGAVGAFGDAKVWNVGTQVAWLPIKNFEIGVEVLYARVDQDVRRFVLDTTNTANNKFDGTTGTVVTRERAGNWTGRMRVERTF
ncbi:MAG: hypothetical protein JWL62_1572 [Hyphomicrobiales bacterium]|nr:hypothetical protein [Hyphomicrobiales bacterium]